MKEQQDKTIWKTFKLSAFWGVLILLTFAGFHKMDQLIPDILYIDENESAAHRLIHQEPWVTSSDTIEVSSGDSYSVTCKLWNVIPLKTVTITQAEAGEVAISGRHTGIYVEMEGILVIDTEELTTMNGENISPAEDFVEKGDYIQTINGEKIDGKDALVSIMEASTGEAVVLGLIRDGHPKQVTVTPVCVSDGSYKLGIWVKDDAQGIGTVTYIKEDGSYGALGHGVSDADTGEIIGIQSGDLYTSEILSVQKGVFGNPGELQGVISYGESQHLGTIEVNSECGIFGRIDPDRKQEIQTAWYPVAFKQEMQVGEATIVCSMGEEIEEYEIEIEEIHWSPDEVNKCFSIHVTDEELLEKTGGIIQGLSGSPIVQNGKLVGAVTHVLVNDPTRGYGIFIENMLDIAS